MRVRLCFGGSLVAATMIAGLGGAAAALEERKDEQDKLKACERSLCALVTKKSPAEGDFKCALSKTWARDKIKEGSATGRVSWVFGDARCSVDLKVPRSIMVEALVSPEATLQVPEHTVTCEIERDKEITPVTLRFAPKLRFKDGKAVKVWVNLKQVDGPSTIKGLAMSVAKLEDGIGIFHKPLIKAINRQIAEKCPKVAAGG